LDFKFGLGVGNTVLNMAGLNVTGLVVDVGVGNTQIDLTGITPADITGTINGGVGNITLRVPQDIGVQITVKHGLGKVQVNGLMVSGDTYTNAAYGKTANTIRLNVSSGLGNIVIEQ
jgi:predicted membrane protein